jgi:hypothetical protein
MIVCYYDLFSPQNRLFSSFSPFLTERRWDDSRSVGPLSVCAGPCLCVFNGSPFSSLQRTMKLLAPVMPVSFFLAFASFLSVGA